MKKHLIFMAIIICAVNRQAQPSATAYKVGVKAGINATKTSYLNGGTFARYFDSRQENPEIGWIVLGSAIAEPHYPVEYEICLGLKKSSSFLVASAWDEDVIEQTFEVFYLSVPFTAKVKLYKYLPDVLAGISLDFPVAANYLSNGHYSYNRYKKSVNADFFDLKTALVIGVGKEIKVAKQSISFEFKYFFHLDDIEYDKMGVFSNSELQFLIAVPLLKFGGEIQ